jgi:hypothetical protein
LQVVNRDNVKLWRVWVDECRAVLDRTFEEEHIYASGSVEARWKAPPDQWWTDQLYELEVEATATWRDDRRPDGIWGGIHYFAFPTEIMIRPGSSPGEVVNMVPFQSIHVGANYHLARDKIPRAKGSLAVHPKLDFGSEWARKPWRLAVKPWSDHGPTFFVFYHYVPIPWEEDQGHGSSSRVAGGAEGDTARRPTAHGPADGGYPRDGLRGTDDRVADDAIDATDNGDRDRVGRGSGSQDTGGASSSSPDFSGRPGLGVVMERTARQRAGME